MKALFFFLITLISLTATRGFCQVPCLTATEKALSANHYLEAINAADPCIRSFRLQSQRIEHRLDSLRVEVKLEPPYTPQEKAAIFHNGLLNDVATVCFYKGKAAEALYDSNQRRYARYRDIAIAAFRMALQFPKGRHWDPQGFFWSPSQAARDQLTEMGVN